MRKFLTTTAIAAVMMTMGGMSAKAAEGVEVLHWWTSGGEAAALDVLKKDLESKGISWTDMPVAGGGGTEAMTVLRARVTAGNAPTAVQMLGFDILDWAKEGALGNLDEIAAKEGWDKVIPTALQQFSKYDGHWIAAPVNVHSTNWVWVNKAALDKAGGKEPTNWDELVSLLDKFKEQGITPVAHGGQPWQDATIFDAVVLSFGNDFYKKAFIDLDPETLGGAQMKEAFDRMTKLRSYVDDNFSGRDWNLASAMVIEGKAGVQFMGDWAKGEFLAKGLKPNQDFYCFATPAQVTSFQYLIDSFGMFTVKDENVQNAQVALAETIMDPKVQKGFNLIKGSIPARNDVSVDDFDDCAKLGYQERAAAIEKGSMQGAMTHGFAAKPEFASVFSDVAAQFFVGKMSSEDAVKMLVSGIDNAR